MPPLAQAQLDSFQWLATRGIKEIFQEVSPVADYANKKFELYFSDISLGTPKCDEHFAKDNKLTYEAPLKATVRLVNKTLHSEKEQEVFLADLPIMTDHGTFIINGVEARRLFRRAARGLRSKPTRTRSCMFVLTGNANSR